MLTAPSHRDGWDYFRLNLPVLWCQFVAELNCG
ncbi:hypothetical protein E2320_012629, partial [Naja naja]